MTEHDRTSTGRPGDDVAAYALGALDEAEAAAFRRHLETCAVCRDELAAFRSVVDVLALSAPQRSAPRSLRRRVLREVRGDRRGAGARQTLPDGSRPAARRRSRPLFGGIAAGLAAAVAAAVVVIVLATSGGPGTRVLDAHVIGPGSAQLQVVANRGSLVVHHFPSPPAGKLYELWVTHGQQPPVPAGAMFDVDQTGSRTVRVPGSLRGVSAVLVTPEPAGGSRVPTHVPVITVDLT